MHIQPFTITVAQSTLDDLRERLVRTRWLDEVHGFGIHFIHEGGQGPKPLPIILTHGWPGSFFEMVKIIPLLTDPASHGGDPNELSSCSGEA